MFMLFIWSLWGRGQKVMMDFDLAEIYGYETRYFNRQIKNIIERFKGEDFMFQLSLNEISALSMCKNCTSIIKPILQTKGIKGGRTKLPYAFTEQGIYMLIIILRGELAIR